MKKCCLGSTLKILGFRLRTLLLLLVGSVVITLYRRLPEFLLWATSMVVSAKTLSPKASRRTTSSFPILHRAVVPLPYQQVIIPVLDLTKRTTDLGFRYRNFGPGRNSTAPPILRPRPESTVGRIKMLCTKKTAADDNWWGLREEKVGFWGAFQCCPNLLRLKKAQITPIESTTPVISIKVLPKEIPSKLSTPKDSPVKSAHSALTRQPFSSGSESSGYFTPPAEPQIVEDTKRHHLEDFCEEPPKSAYDQQKEPYGISQNDLPKTPHRDLSDSQKEPYRFADNLQNDPYRRVDLLEEPYKDGRSPRKTSKDQNGRFITLDPTSDDDPIEITPTKTSLPGTPLRLPKIDPLPTNVKSPRSTFSSLENLDLYASPNYSERRPHSKSEVDLSSKTKITRKTVYSAPITITNSESSNKSCPNFCEEFHTEIILPGAIVDVNETIQIKEINKTEDDIEEIKKSPPEEIQKFFKTPEKYDEFPPFSKPKDGFSETLLQLESPDWESTMKGLQNLMRLLKHHQQLIEAQIHTVCVLLGKHIKNLRSQVARQACNVASEMFTRLKKNLEIELEELATPLLHRTADTNKFLRSDANSALDSMCLHISPPKVVSVVTSKGSCHQNALVRSTSARLLCCLTHRLGHERVFQLPKETRDKILLTGANMLMEGSLETRKHAKMLLGHLAKHCQFHKAITEAVPPKTLRHIEKTLKSLK